MPDTIQLPNGQGFVQTGETRRDDDKSFFLLQSVKDAQIAATVAHLDVKNHVSAESASTRLLVSEHTRAIENLVKGMETNSMRQALQDAKDEVTALKITAKATPAI